MISFECGHCGHRLYFENTHCEFCKSTQGYHWESGAMIALKPGEGSGNGGKPPVEWRDASGKSPTHFRLCANAAHGVCNWLLSDGSNGSLCRACELNRVIPDLTVAGYPVQWKRLEIAKHRLVYSLLKLQLPLLSKLEDMKNGLCFDFLAPTPGGPPVSTGHENGVITIDIAEANPGERELTREKMGESYRTLLGHMRHEVGHYYWDRLVRDGGQLEGFRACFGDEREDYGQALQRYYQKGPKPDWRQNYVTVYASAHPWEDWAECWAHYLHMLDTLETAFAYGLRLKPQNAGRDATSTAVDFPAYREKSLDRLMRAWLPVTTAVNSLNRSMGQPDLYPFVVPAPVLEKFRYIHNLVRDTAKKQRKPAKGSIWKRAFGGVNRSGGGQSQSQFQAASS